MFNRECNDDKSIVQWLGATSAHLRLSSLLGVTPAWADPVADFYKDKTISLIISTGVGGGYDTTARAVARYLTKYVPGNPTVVPKNMPGAGNVLAANYMANVAPKDGTTIATIAQAAFLLQPLGEAGVRFDAKEFYYLGIIQRRQFHHLRLAHDGCDQHRRCLQEGTVAGSNRGRFRLLLFTRSS